MGIGLDNRIAANAVFHVFRALRVRTRLVFPNGAPPSTMDPLCAVIQSIHASIPFFRVSGVEFCMIVSNAAGSAIRKS